ncbi:MAG: serine hydrolase domain-containing protein, partial [Bacteroidota bacterium]
MKKLIISVAMMALLSCQSLDIPAPDAQVNCTIATTTHPKHAAYQGLLDRYTAQGIPGLNLLLDHPVDGCWQGAAGYADVEAGIPLSPCHRMITASLIKSYIAVIVLQLAEEGKLSLEDQLTPYLDEKLLRRIPNGQTATIRQLLQCRSGMPDVFETDFLLDFLNQPTRQYSMEELMRYLYGVKPAAAPGERFYYGDGNFILLSMLIEKVDAPLKESYQTRIFDRLGSTDAFLVEQPDELPTQVPASYWDRYGN